jgi:hypothetical protein
MTAKEEANELVQQYVINMPIPFHIEDAKICALIAVDEILKVAFYAPNEIYEHYIQVKNEIEKL